jgi:hypothetical protein
MRRVWSPKSAGLLQTAMQILIQLMALVGLPGKGSVLHAQTSSLFGGCTLHLIVCAYALLGAGGCFEIELRLNLDAAYFCLQRLLDPLY